MIIDVTNELYTELKNTLTGITVLPSYPDTTPSFPCVTIEEFSNETSANHVDTAGEKFNDVSLEINIFTNTETKIYDAKQIRNSIDAILGDKYRMLRTFSNTVPNYADRSIYRYTLRYDFSVDSNRMIYKR